MTPLVGYVLWFDWRSHQPIQWADFVAQSFIGD